MAPDRARPNKRMEPSGVYRSRGIRELCPGGHELRRSTAVRAAFDSPAAYARSVRQRPSLVTTLAFRIAALLSATVPISVTRHGPLARCGVVSDPARREAEVVPGYYALGEFHPDDTSGLPLHRVLRGISSLGARVDVVIEIDSTEAYHWPSYKAAVTPEPLPSDGLIVFCDTTLKLIVHPSGTSVLDSSVAQEVRNAVRIMHDQAMRYDPEVGPHDSLDFSSPVVRQTPAAAGVILVWYSITLRLTRSPPSGREDDRASGFAIYSTSERRVLYATFGHPEWSPMARTVNAVSPRMFFSVAGDRRVYLLAATEGAWESSGSWVIFDVQAGKPVTRPDLQP